MNPQKTPIGRMNIQRSKDVKISFRKARFEDLPDLKLLYESAWGAGITIRDDQLMGQMHHFPEGQIVGCLQESGRPVSMINIMLSVFDPKQGFKGGYQAVTGDRTFSSGMSIEAIGRRLDADEECLAIAFCVSVAVDPALWSSGLAAKTIEQAIGLAESHGLIAAPYSAPRGYGSALERNPDLDIIDYLHMSKPMSRSMRMSEAYKAHRIRIEALNASPHRIGDAFHGGIELLDFASFEFYQSFGPDPTSTAMDGGIFARFLERDGNRLFKRYNRAMEIEDFCILTGRKLRDPVLGMHLHLGARFIRDEDGGLSAIFPGSRPEDTLAAGYNVIMTYGYNPLLGQRF